MLLYNLGIRLYGAAIGLAALFNDKARLLHAGRANSFALLKAFTKKSNHKVIWFHCASLGEFEQARPIIERLKQTHTHLQVAVSFFSPSGYEIRKNYAHADVVFYLPQDTNTHAQMVLNLLQPDVVCFVKYEIWLLYIQAIKHRHIPLYLISATFRPDHIYFKWYGGIFKKALAQFNAIFTQDKRSLKLLTHAGFTNGVFSNDTRYDRVFAASKAPKDLPVISSFKGEGLLLIAGSSYQPEEKMIASILGRYPQLKVVVAPHNIGESRIGEIEQSFTGFACIRYSQANENNVHDKRVLIIDNIGLLSSAYRYGDLAFIGGGFGHKGIHNTLEAAAFGMPVFIGPNNQEKFPETALLSEAGILFTITQESALEAKLNVYTADLDALNKVKQQALQFISKNTGATEVVVSSISGL